MENIASQSVRILALSDSPALINDTTATGFGRVARNLYAEWTKIGQRSAVGGQSSVSIDVWAINFTGWGYDSCLEWRLFPAGGRDWFTSKRLQGFIDRIANGDYTHVFILMDLDPFSFSDFTRQLKAVCKEKKVRTMIYFPVDAAVEPEWCGIVAAVDVAVSYTHYGREQVRKAMAKSLFPIHVLPHGVEPYFKKLAPEARAKYRDIDLDLNGQEVKFVKPGDFVMLNVNKNEWRKDPFRSLEILKELRDEGVPAKLILRMAPDSAMGGIQVERAARQIGLTAGVEYALMPQISEPDMVGLYNAADLYLTTTRGEGWGLGIAEALACGTPVAMPFHTACAEIVSTLNKLAREQSVSPPQPSPGAAAPPSPAPAGEGAIVELPLSYDRICGADSRVRPCIDTQGAVMAIEEFYHQHKAERLEFELSDSQREWLSWPRIARDVQADDEIKNASTGANGENRVMKEAKRVEQGCSTHPQAGMPALQIPGWYDWHDWATQTIHALPDGAVYVEVGAFLGKSTTAIAGLIRDSGKKIAFHAIDTFELPATTEPELLRIVTEATGGLRVFRKQFEANLRAANVRKLVKIGQRTSLAAAEEYETGTVDVVFIDADHSYEAVRADIVAWWRTLKPGGVMAGHDIRTYDSVFRAVHDGIKQVGGQKLEVKIIAEQNIWEAVKV